MRATVWRRTPARTPVDPAAAAATLAWFRGMAAGAPPSLGTVTDETAALLTATRVAASAVVSGAQHPSLPAAAAREFTRAAVLEAASTRVVESLESAGIACALLKGAPLARRFWPDGAVRDMGDVDVLVASEAYPQARAALLASDYELCEGHHPRWYVRRWFYHESLVMVGRPVLVELHWDFVRPGLGDPQVGALLDDAVRTPCGGGTLPCPSDAWQLLVVAVHALHELFGLRQLLDVALVARALDDEGWARAVEAAARTRLTTALYYAVSLSAARLGWRPPAAVARLRPGRAHDALVRRYVAAVPSLSAPGRGVLQLHHVMAPLLHCRGSRCVTRLPHAMLTDRANIAADLQRLADIARGRGRSGRRADRV